MNSESEFDIGFPYFEEHIAFQDVMPMEILFP
jgi:hypothetical protein